MIGNNLHFQKDNLPQNMPKHIEIAFNWDQIKDSKGAFEFNNPDAVLSHQMNLLSDDDGIPLLYYSDIVTPVCIDGLCKPVYVEMYWDLMGQYTGYGEFPGEILSKFDHENFETEDYMKLHELLLDHTSVLGRRKLSALYDIRQERKIAITFKGIEVDGVSGATKKEIKTAIVDGALYSCYALWHLANGTAALKIKEQLPEIYSESLATYFLNSGHDGYQHYALKMMPKSEFGKNIDQVTAILLTGKTLTRAYGLKKMPKELFSNSVVIERLFGNIAEMDFNARTLMIKGLKYSQPSAAMALSGQVKHMSKNQLKSFLKTMESNSAFQTEEVLELLSSFMIETKYPYEYMISDFLDNLK
ncbi:MAG: hypothetical protein ACI9FN_003485 [Saprospiraceae bacterium]